MKARQKVCADFANDLWEKILRYEGWIVTPAIALVVAVFLVTEGWSAPLKSRFEIGSAEPKVLKLGDLLSSSTFVAESEQVFERAQERVLTDSNLSEQEKQAILVELAEMQVASTVVTGRASNQPIDELPFKRILDISIIFPGIPDILGLCLEGYPTNQLSIEGCASTAIFLSSLSATVKYRWDLVLSQTPRGRIHQLSFGPGAGLRHVSYLCFDACQDASIYADFMGSLEYNYWFKPHLGLSLQFDAGATALLGRIDSPYGANDVPGVIPLGRFSFGLAF